MKQQTFLSLTGKSLLIWFCTNTIATSCYLVYIVATEATRPSSSNNSLDTVCIISAFGLVFSFPVNFFLVPALYLLTMLRRTRDKVVYAISLVLFLSLGVIVFFVQSLDWNVKGQFNIVIFLLPYIIGAVISFFAVARKMIFSNFSPITATTNHPEKL